MNSIAFLLVVAVGAVSAQRNVDPKNAAILAEARYLQGDGSFGAAYVQEDGVEFKEETGTNGERKGQYSYIDPTGKKITVHYTAGKGGFQVSGDHLPKAPAPLPAAAPHHQPRQQQYSAPPQYNPAPQHNAIHQYQQPSAPVAPRQSYPSASGADDDGQYRPELHEAPYQYKDDGTGGASSSQYAPAPQHFNQGFNYQHQAAFAQQNNNYQQQQQQPAAFAPQPTTPQPNRFFPPGQLDLNRTPDGFNFQFQSRQ